MKKLYSTLGILLAILMLAAAQCGGAPVKEAPAEKSAAVAAPDIEIVKPFARASIPNGAVYMMIKNNGETDDALIGAKTDVAETAELHETRIDENEVMRMRPIDAVELPAGGSAVLEPGGMHLMLIGLQKELVAGDTFELTLNFKQSGSQTIEVEVTEDMAMDHGDMDHSAE
jgi:copper(I)-binding protein